MTKFTDALIRKLEPQPRAFRVFEGGALPGFGITVSPGGGKSFFLQHTRQGVRRFYRIGAYPAMPLSAAREKAQEFLSQIERGIDPRAESGAPPTGTFEMLLQAWVRHLTDEGRRHVREMERLVRGNVKPKMLGLPAKDVTSAHMREVLAAVHKRGARVTANRLRAYLHSLFAYGLKADHDPRRIAEPALFGLSANPVTAIPRDAGAEVPRDRVLSWDEVRTMWDSDSLSWPARQACRLLLLTGARVNEIAQAAWGEFDLSEDIWTLPAERSKNRRMLLVPITPLLKEYLGELHGAFPESAWLFPARNSCAALKPWSNTAMSHAVKAARLDWRPQDLRRTMKTLAAGAGIGRDILDRIQNHALHDVASRHYDRYDYLAEKRAALERWEAELRMRLPRGA